MAPALHPIRWFSRATSAHAARRRSSIFERHSLELLVLQPSPFCNLDCSYCYLPHRDDRRRMSLETLQAALCRVRDDGLLSDRVTLVWHAGEPTAVPIDWYRSAFDIAHRVLEGVRVDHHFQTNAVLLDDSWCDFIVHWGIRIGVSVDGPQALHDRHRRTRAGSGTHVKVMRGISYLQARAIPFNVIAVLTREALEEPDAMYDFMTSLGASEIGFNVEEIELEHAASSLQGPDADAAVRAFWRRLLWRLEREPGRLRLREVESTLAALLSPRFGQFGGNQQNRPGRILSVGWDGNYCFWSPELLGASHADWTGFALGNVNDLPRPFGDEPMFRPVQASIDEGVAACRRECRYFDFCLGGAPVNKLFERGTFAATATVACRLGLQAHVDEVLSQLDRNLLPSSGPTR